MSAPAPPPPSVRAILFDLDDTLVPWQTLPHWQWAWRPRGPVLSERHARSAIRRSIHLWDRRRWQGLVGRAPPVDVEAYRGFLTELLYAIAGHPLPEVETRAVVDRFLKPAHEMESFPEAAGTLRALEARGIRSGVITGLPAESGRLALRRAGLPEHLLLVAGDSADPRPPSASGYREAVKRLGSKPSETWFVGDLFWSDVRAAARAGLTAVLIDRPNAADQVLETRIRTLSELLPMLDAPRTAPVPAPPAADEPGPG